MKKIDIHNLIDGQRLAPLSSTDIEFTYNFFNTSENLVSIQLYIDDSKDFPNPIVINPDSLLIFDIDQFIAYRPNNTISKDDIGNRFKFTFTFPDTNGVKYVKIVATEGLNAFDSSPVLVSTLNALDFTLNPIQLTEMPTKIKVDDKKNIILPEYITISVYACNNALDNSPTWEIMTTEYLNGSFFAFINKTKTANNWAISVRYIITKSNYNAGIDIEEVFVAYI